MERASVIRASGDHFAELSDGLFMTAELRQRHAVIEMSVGLSGPGGENALKTIRPLVMPSEPAERIAEMLVRRNEIWLERQRLFERRYGFLVAQKSREHDAEVAVGYGVVRIDGEGMPVGLDSFLVTLRRAESAGQIAVKSRRTGIARDRFAQPVYRFVKPLALHAKRAKPFHGVEMTGLGPQDGPVVRLGLFEPPGLRAQRSQPFHGLEVAGLGLQHGPVMRLRLRQHALPM